MQFKIRKISILAKVYRNIANLNFQILNAVTEDILEHQGSFRTPVEQVDYIRKSFECGGKFSEFVFLCIFCIISFHWLSVINFNFVLFFLCVCVCVWGGGSALVE